MMSQVSQEVSQKECLIPIGNNRFLKVDEKVRNTLMTRFPLSLCVRNDYKMPNILQIVDELAKLVEIIESRGDILSSDLLYKELEKSIANY